MTVIAQTDLPIPLGYVNREDARNLEAGMADCMLMMREQTGKFERPVYSRPEKKGLATQPFGCPVPSSAERAGRIYVAGPMSGIADFNFPVFNAAAAMLRYLGWTVENPAEHSLADNLEWADYMAYDLTRLGLCGAIYLLPGWSKSKGATIEKDLATALGMKVQFDPNAEQCLDVEPLRGAAEDHGRLQAEVSALQQRLTIADQRVDDLESELTKARELIADMVAQQVSAGTDYTADVGRAKAFIACNVDESCGQNAPAAKGSRETVDLHLKEPSFYRNKDND